MGAIREIKQKYFGEGDLEAFFGLFGDVFSKIAAIIGVLYFAEGFPADIVMGKILPGIGVGSIAGSLIYFWEAYDLGKKEGRTDVTALPFGVSSTQVFAWIYLIIVPIYRQTGNALHAWQVAVAACFLGGLVEIAGGFVSKLLMKWIPNAALMGNMAAGALVWLSLNGFVTVFETPLVSVIPLFLIFLAQKMKKPLIKGIPNTVLIVGTGVALAWLTGQCNIAALQKSAQTFGVYPPQLSILDVTKGISQIGPYLSIIIPLQIANFLSTMQASESAAMAGDNYPVKRTMILDGVTTVLSSLTGSPFPTTVYYGHPGWKKVGTRSGYSLMMAVVYLSCFFGLPLLILDIIPYEVIIVLLVLVGLNVTSDVVDNMEKEYSGVIFISLFPILAQYIVSAVSDTSVISHAFEVLSYGAFTSSQIQWNMAHCTREDMLDKTLYFMDDEEYKLYKENKIPVMAYSPQAVGFFSKYLESGEEKLSDRAKMYCTDVNKKRAEKVRQLCEKLGCSPAALCVAYITCNPVDGYAVVSNSTMKQMEDTLTGVDLKITQDMIDWILD